MARSFDELNISKRVRLEAKKSSCKKRVVVCIILNSSGKILSAASNSCSPRNDICERLNISEDNNDYSLQNCNWQHAEIHALEKLPKSAAPHTALLFGHSFFCSTCKEKLRKKGIELFRVYPDHKHTGLINDNREHS